MYSHDFYKEKQLGCWNSLRKEVYKMAKQGENIYLRKDGRWEGRYPKNRENGKLKYGYIFGKTYEEVKEKLGAIQGQTHIASKESFDAVSAEWFEIQKPQLKPSSIAKYSNILRNYLSPEFGNRDVCTITRNEVMVFSRELLESGGTRANGLSAKTVNSVLSVMRNVFQYASREKTFPVADIADISAKQSQKPLRILSWNEQQRLNEFLCNDLTLCNLGILICLYTGLRIGEICALKWEDMLLAEPCVYVHKTMQRIQLFGNDGRKTKVVILPPKSECSIRKIPLPEDLLPLLLNEQKPDDAFLLTGTANAYMEPRTLENHFKAAAEACNIQDVHFHSLRHTFATRCVELGFDVKSLSEILGHANVNITMNRYVHPSMELKKKNMNKLSGLLTTK